ncbi:MAG: hypothetical protein II931_01340 [Clostridia bacterium]|nr:hypothetical protein [Clostridia bacterium]
MGTHIEIERKYLIEIPDIEVLKSQPNYNASFIEQMYISADGSGEYKGDRIRKRVYDDVTKYYKTHKEYISGLSKLEIEDEISEEEYQKLSENILPNSRAVRKVRHCFDFNNQVVELDVYEFWSDKATAEVEIDSESRTVTLPEFIKIIADVTGDKAYSNYALSFSQT